MNFWWKVLQFDFWRQSTDISKNLGETPKFEIWKFGAKYTNTGPRKSFKEKSPGPSKTFWSCLTTASVHKLSLWDGHSNVSFRPIFKGFFRPSNCWRIYNACEFYGHQADTTKPLFGVFWSVDVCIDVNDWMSFFNSRIWEWLVLLQRRWSRTSNYESHKCAHLCTVNTPFSIMPLVTRRTRKIARAALALA